MAKYKLFDSVKSALQAGCAEKDLIEKNKVFYCSCSCDTTKKEEKAVKTTKEFKVDGKKETKGLNNEINDN